MGRGDKIQNIGVLGGTFDPVHKGHLSVANSVRAKYGLDQILFVPAFLPPHKDRKLTLFTHRVAMLEACLEDIDFMSVSLIEAERNGPSYTVETLREMHQRMKSCILHLIVGADMFVEIDLWYRFQELFQLAHIIVAARPGISLDRIMKVTDRLPGEFVYDKDQQTWSRDDGSIIYYFADTAEPVSSSKIRQNLSRGISIDEYVSMPVREYIMHYGLYRTSAETG